MGARVESYAALVVVDLAPLHEAVRTAVPTHADPIVMDVTVEDLDVMAARSEINGLMEPAA